jgi:hypothetical protein
MDPSLDDLDLMLRGIRPRPSSAFVVGLEADLKQAIRPRRFMPRLGRPLPRLVAFTGFATGLAAIVLALSVSGALPLKLGGDQRAAAGRECRTVTEWHLERQPHLHVSKLGRLQITNTTVLVQRRVLRCH